MITVHHLNNSRSQRVLWLLEELGVPYEVKRYERNAKTMLAPPELRAVHPLGKSPVITDDGQVIAESGAIIEYLADRYGNGALAPAPGTPQRLRYSYWLHYAEGSVMPLLVIKLVLSQVPKGVPLLIRPVANAIVNGVGSRFLDPNLKLHLQYLEGELSRQDWFAGTQFSAADVQMSFPIEALGARGGALPPKLSAWLKRVQARPAYQRALERGGPYALLK